MVRKTKRSLVLALFSVFACSVTSSEYEYQGVGVDDLTIIKNNRVCTLQVKGSDVKYQDDDCSTIQDERIRLTSHFVFLNVPTKSLDLLLSQNSDYIETFIDRKNSIKIAGVDFGNGYSVTVIRKKPISANYIILFSKEFGIISITRNIHGTEGGAITWILKGHCGYGGLCIK